ncbi:hypothetical protein A2693_03950 [Candidatus Curtissbacteria bacterium RIFCSPHIGHO2_01_FULL_40_12]|uniref:Uncharacterized protein n=1 Tax=Candidatus Curtissbacteria bacterium RIFCSPHIGHO2_01_FULL_40_12 TaxID=1797710 RepID=A0A1F5G7A7_9BACT|nr:MAG: hypothetical protein A2693_03950 [Candidatus Curtissbacteria bacterium RIFCSPHIGHO2_01_FULL_40_12]
MKSMEQHPIPGAITAYKFKLVGDMTLKQFLELAAGVVSAWVLFNSGANFAIKWTLGPVLAFFGFALAFLPIEDRPLDQWIINFVKAIYSPTQFLYRPKVKKLDIFETVKKTISSAPILSKKGQGQLSEYLESLPVSSTSAFDQAEAKYLEHIANLFGALGNKIVSVATKSQPAPAPLPTRSGVKGVRVRQLLHPQMCLLPRATIYQAPAESQVAAMPTIQKPVSQLKTANAVKPAAPTPKPITPPAKPKTQTTAPTFATDILLPQKPERPNLIAGITLDKDGKIIPGVILEIRDSQGFPVRALKSNKLGQFFIATALPDGIYEISAEHDGHKFAIIKLEAKNEIIPPLKIQAVA